MTHYMNLCSEPFNSIKDKEKIYELRLLDPKRQKVKVGNIIIFTNLDNKETLSVKVVGLHKFSSFEELYNNLPLDKCGYNKVIFIWLHLRIWKNIILQKSKVSTVL